jgi:hypothetical protein
MATIKTGVIGEIRKLVADAIAELRAFGPQSPSAGPIDRTLAKLSAIDGNVVTNTDPDPGEVEQAKATLVAAGHEPDAADAIVKQPGSVVKINTGTVPKPAPKPAVSADEELNRPVNNPNFDPTKFEGPLNVRYLNNQEYLAPNPNFKVHELESPTNKRFI